MSSTAKFVNYVTVIDPDTLGEVEVAIYKHQGGGGMFGIDSSFVEQVLDGDDDQPLSIYDPFVSMGQGPRELHLLD